MNVSGVQSQNTSSYQQVNKQQGEDPVIKNAQSQIEELRKQLRELTENEDMDAKTKSEKKQQIQQQISDLSAQIRQRQLEIRKEQQAPKENSQKSAQTETEKENKEASGFSTASAGALISASNSLDNANALGSVKTKLSGRARELTAEIKTDMQRGADVSAKQAELEKVNKGAKNAASAQAEALSEADSTLKSAAEDDLLEKNADRKESDEEKEIRTDGTYDKDGNRTEGTDPDENDFEDKA